MLQFTPKDWRNATTHAGGGDTSTPLSAVAIEDLETRVTDYTDTRVPTPGFAVVQGLVADSEADAAANTAAIQAELVEGAGTVAIPDGGYFVNDTIDVPNFCRLTGVSSGGGSVLKAVSTWTAANPVVTMGDSTAENFPQSVRIEHLELNVNNEANVGVYSNNINENCGLFDVRITNVKTTGVKIEFDGSADVPQHFGFQELNITGTGDGTGYGVDLASASSELNGWFCIGLTVSGNFAAGVRMKAISIPIIQGHFESCAIGVDLGTATQQAGAFGPFLANITGHQCTTIVRIRAGANLGCSIHSVRDVTTTCTNLLVDDVSTVTLTSAALGTNLGAYINGATYINGTLQTGA
jgi:hypothetical protein